MIPKSYLYPVLLSALATLAACDTAEERAQKHLQSALELIEGGDVDRALVEFRNVFELDPNNLQARHALAKVHDGKGDTRAGAPR